MVENCRRVLLVEDDSDMRGLAKIFLEEGGIPVTVVDTVESIGSVLENGGFTEVITDGMYGGWRTVVEEARRLGLYVSLWSNDDEYIRAVINMGGRVIGKSGNPNMFEELVADPRLLDPSTHSPLRR